MSCFTQCHLLVIETAHPVHLLSEDRGKGGTEDASAHVQPAIERAVQQRSLVKTEDVHNLNARHDFGESAQHR